MNLYLTDSFVEDNMAGKHEKNVVGFTRHNQNFIAAINRPGILLEEFIHYCDAIIGAQSGHAAKARHTLHHYSNNPKALSAVHNEGESYQRLMNALAGGFVKGKSRKEVETADTFFTHIIFKPSLREYNEIERPAEHLANMCKLLIEIRSPNSEIRKMLNLRREDEKAYFEERFPESYAMAIDFEKQCKKEVTRLKEGGKPLYTPGQVQQSQQQFFPS